MPEQLTRTFQDAREAAGVGSDNPQSFHEIRSLGSELLSESGWAIEKVQGLMGHASPSMTEHYLEGHDTSLGWKYRLAQYLFKEQINSPN